MTERPILFSGPMVRAMKLGTYYSDYGGEFHGLVRGEEGKPDYMLFSAVKNQAENKTFDECAEHAKNLKVMHKGVQTFEDYIMPIPREQQIQMANAGPGSFAKAWYWSGLASDSGYAWLQTFGDGLQSYWYRDYRHRACPVRRVPV